MTETVRPEEAIRRSFAQAGIDLQDVVVRQFPDETVYVLEVATSDVARAAEIAARVDLDLTAANVRAFTTVRGVAQATKLTPLKGGIQDARVVHLVNLLIERSRASESQASLSYIRDAGSNLAKVMSRRHNLVFGRRGAGKSALLVEAKSALEASGQIGVWINVQTYRTLPSGRVALWVANRILGTLSGVTREAKYQSLYDSIASLMNLVEASLSSPIDSDDLAVNQIAPRLREVLSRYTISTGRAIFVFLDDLHYLPRERQPYVLDIVHGFVRDAEVWLKIACIRHLARWFIASPPTGLQSTHDAVAIDLDVTLQTPTLAKEFLESVLLSFANHAGIASLNSIFRARALDRLVLASGAVPRDYLVLASSALSKARNRPNARVVGVQEINTAAGDASKVKIEELEEDLAASGEPHNPILQGLHTLREFCTSEHGISFFRVNFRDKEQNIDRYRILENLLDLRLIHLLEPSLSDAKIAGTRYEVYMLDLSQFSGTRLKRRLAVLDFVGAHLILRETGRKSESFVGDTPRKLINILRRGPLLELHQLSH